jgi:hypothetical protein
MRHIKILIIMSIIGTLVFGIALTALGQTFTLTNNARPFYNIFLVADLGLRGEGKPNTVFSITFDNSAQAGNYQVRITVRDDTSGDILLDGITDAGKAWNTSFRGQTFTNWNIADEENLGGDFDLNQDAQNLYDQILATGSLPRGTFTILLQLLPEGSSTPDDQDALTIQIVPPYLQPLYPSFLRVNRAVLNFRWVSNIANQELHIYLDPGANREVLAGSRLPFLGIGSVAGNPQTQQVEGAVIAPVLNNGVFYYWQIWGDIITSHGLERVKGVLTPFQYFEEFEQVEYFGLSDSDKQAIKDLLMEMIAQVIGGRQGQRAARSIEGYDITSIFLDNGVVSREQVMTILQEILDGNIQAKEVRFQ